MDQIDKTRNLEIFGYEIPAKKEDKCYLICSLGNHSVESTLRALERTLKKRGVYRCSKCYSASEEGRTRRSKLSKELWANPAYAAHISLKSKEVANTRQGRKQRSIQAKNAWRSSDYSEFHRERTTELFKSEAHRNIVSERNKKDYENDPEKYLSEKVSALSTDRARRNHKLALANPEYRKLQSELAIERFKNDSYRAKIAKGLEEFPRGGRMSHPEKEIKSVLDGLGINYIYNKAVGPYNFDFYIADHNLYIEMQGEYWHSLPKNERRDKSKYTYLKTAYPDSRIIYIWDYDFNTGNAEYKLRTALNLEINLKTHEFDFNLCELKPVNPKEAKTFLNCWHYAQYGKAAKYMYGAYLKGQLIALTKIGPVSRKGIVTSLGYDTKECYELDRFCIHPFYHKKNFGSFLLSRSIREFFGVFSNAKAVVSFADSTYGHEGTIYKASNWTEVGKVKPDYVYRSPDGWILHKKTLYNQAASVHMTEAAYVKKHGYEKVYGKEKTKFVIRRSHQ